MILDAVGDEISVGDFCFVARPAAYNSYKIEQKPMLLARTRILSEKDIALSELVRSKLPTERLSDLMIKEAGVMEASFIFSLDFGNEYDCVNLYRFPVDGRSIFSDVVLISLPPYYINNSKVAKLFELRDLLLSDKLSFKFLESRSNLMKIFG